MIKEKQIWGMPQIKHVMWGWCPEIPIINRIYTKLTWLEYYDIHNEVMIRIGYLIKLYDFIYRSSMNVPMKNSQKLSFDHGISTSKELWVWFKSIHYEWFLPLMLN